MGHITVFRIEVLGWLETTRRAFEASDNSPEFMRGVYATLHAIAAAAELEPGAQAYFKPASWQIVEARTAFNGEY